MKDLLTAIGIPLLALRTFTLGRWHKREFSPVPVKRMWFDSRDFKACRLVRWPVRGKATLFCSKFTISFEGESWSEMSLVRAQFQVDGRYGGFSGPDTVPSDEEMGNGVRSRDDGRKRETLITFKKHRFIYCDYLNTLRASGEEYLTAGAPVHLSVSRSGAVTRLM